LFSTHIDSDLGHRRDDCRIDPVGWLGPARDHHYLIPDEMAEPRGCDLGTTGVVHAGEHDRGLLH
jgi:hypothetical protein